MRDKHWSDEELLEGLYELRSPDTHLEQCRECNQRWQHVLAWRQVMLQQPAVSSDLLAAQRRRVYSRMEADPHRGWSFSLAPALAALSMVVLGLLLSNPRPVPPPTLASSDAQFFTEVYSMLESTEPRAVAPIRALFEDYQ